MCCLAITALFSIIDYHPNWRFWGLEILRDLVIAFSTGWTCYLLGFLFQIFRDPPHWRRGLLTAFVLLIGGWLGAWLAWWLNTMWFGFQVSSLPSFRNQLALMALPLGMFPYVAFILVQRLRRAKLNLQAKEMAAQKLLQAKTKAELETLRAKVQPHFLFNTLNSIASLIPTHPQEAELMVQKLSQMFRYTLNHDSHDFVNLAEEFQILSAYLDIEKTRLGQRLIYDLNLHPQLREFPIPWMLLQPLVENAVIHGIAKAPQGGRITVHATPVAEGCQLSVENTGYGNGVKPERLGFGISGVSDRLELIYGSKFGFQMMTSPHWRICLTLPVDQGEASLPLASVPHDFEASA